MQMTRTSFYAWMLAGCALLVGCKEEEKKEAAPASDYSQATTNLGAVANGMLPASLKSNFGIADMCNGVGFFGCQPEFLKLYVSIPREILASTQELLSVLASGLQQNLVPGAKGSVNTTDGEVTKIDYDYPSSTAWQVLLHTAKGPFIYYNVDGGRYTVEVYAANQPGTDTSMSDMRFIVDYTSDTQFKVDLFVIDSTCDDSDFRAPERTQIKIARAGDLWTGKSMLYMPRWRLANGSKCSTAATDTSKAFMYTDFAGNDTNTTASLFFMPSSVSAVDQIANYPISNLCTTFNNVCVGGYGFGDPQPVSSRKNPFCTTQNASTWDKACDDVPVSSYSAASEWTVPGTLSTSTIATRASL